MMINKYKLADQMRNSMHIPDEYLEHLEVYKMVHLKLPAFRNELRDGQMYWANIQSNDKVLAIMYDVIYHQCTPARAKKAQEVRASFRAANPELGIHPIVLVQVVID